MWNLEFNQKVSSTSPAIHTTSYWNFMLQSHGIFISVTVVKGKGHQRVIDLSIEEQMNYKYMKIIFKGNLQAYN